MDLATAALLGLVQGLTEFLPISSTAHLLVTERLVGFSDPSSVFAITIQFGSILAVMWLYREKLLSVVRGLPSDPEARRFVVMLLVATVVAFHRVSALAAILLYPYLAWTTYAAALTYAIWRSNPGVL